MPWVGNLTRIPGDAGSMPVPPALHHNSTLDFRKVLRLDTHRTKDFLYLIGAKKRVAELGQSE